MPSLILVVAIGFLLAAIFHVYSSRSAKKGQEGEAIASAPKDARAVSAPHQTSPTGQRERASSNPSARTPFSMRKPASGMPRKAATPLGSTLNKERLELDEARDEASFLQQVVSQLFLLLATSAEKESYGFSVTASKSPQNSELPKIALNRYAAPPSSAADTFYLESVNGRHMMGMTAQDVKDVVSSSRFKVKLGLRSLERPDKKGPGLKSFESIVYSSRVQNLRSLSQRINTFIKTERVIPTSIIPSLQKGISAVLDMIEESDSFESPGNSAENLEESVTLVIGKVFSLVLQPSNKLSISRDLSNSFDKENNFSDDTMVLREQIVNMQKQHVLVKSQLQEETKRVHQLQSQLQSEKNACEHWCGRVKELEAMLREKEASLSSGAQLNSESQSEMASLREILSERQHKLYSKLTAFDPELLELTKKEEAFPERVEEVMAMARAGHADVSHAHKSSLSELTEANILLEDLIYSCFDSIGRNERSKRDQVEQSSKSAISDVQARYNILMKYINEESIPSVSEEQGPGLKTIFDQTLIVVRHGERLDTVDESWSGTRPYDPPLTSKGKEEAFRTGVEMAEKQPEIHLIAVSPFLRCVETAISMLEGLESSERYRGANLQIFVDYGLSEWLSERNMKKVQPVVCKIKDYQDLEAKYLPRIHDVDEDCDAAGKSFPTYPESQEESCMRYKSTFERLLHRFPGKNVLAVTHGDAVAQFTASALKVSKDMVYSVPLCSYVSCAFSTGGWDLVDQHPEILVMSELE